MQSNLFGRKIDFYLLAATIMAAIVAVAGVILQAVIELDAFGNIDCFLYWLKAGGMASLSFSMIVIGLLKVRLREKLRFSIISVALGLLLGLVYGIGGIYKNQIFSGFLKEKKLLIDNISSDMRPEILCQYAFTLAESIYYLRGEITTYMTCEGGAFSFSPTERDIDQRNHVLFIENSASRAKNTSFFFFLVLSIAVLSGLTFPKKPKALQ